MEEPKFLAKLRTREIGWFDNLLWSNPLSAAWSLVLVVGAIVLIVYAAEIGFLPALDGKEVTTIVVAGAAMAAVIVIVLSVILIYPGAAWVEMTKTEGMSAFAVKGAVRQRVHGIAWFSLLICGTVAALYLGMADLWLGVAVCVLMFGAVTAKLFLDERPLKHVLAVVHYCVFSAVMVVYAYGLLSKVAGASVPQLLQLGAIVLSMNWIVLGAGHATIKTYLYVGVGALLLVLLFGDKMSLISDGVARHYKLGNFEAVLLLNEDGCVAYGAAVRKEITVKNHTCETERLTIRSRLGSEYLVEAARDDTKVEILLPKAYARGVLWDGQTGEK